LHQPKRERIHKNLFSHGFSIQAKVQTIKRLEEEILDRTADYTRIVADSPRVQSFPEKNQIIKSSGLRSNTGQPHKQTNNTAVFLDVIV